jgi:hypothetical protein
MKFAYVDESGNQSQSDVFVMVGIVIDAYRLRKYTAKFDEMITQFLKRHPGSPQELKTKAFINGAGGWSQVDAADRKKFLGQICDLAAECARIFGVAFSLAKFKQVAESGQTPVKSYWLSAAMFVSGLVQKKMQSEAKNKGLTVLICDDNKQEMANLADELHAANPWFDPLYQISTRSGGVTIWKDVPDGGRFDQIVNCAFAIKSHQSSLIQVADAVAYIYRRHLELQNEKEAWKAEKDYFSGLVSKLEGRRERLGHTPGGPCIDFYEAACHTEWKL